MILPGFAVHIPRAPARLEINAIASSNVNDTTYTFTSQSIGQPGPGIGRRVIVVAAATGFTNPVVSSISIDGSDGVIHQRVEDAADSIGMALASRKVPGPTSCTIVVNWSAMVARCQIIVASLRDGRQDAPFDTFGAKVNDAGNTQSGALHIPSNGAGLWVGCKNAATTSSWSGALEILAQNVPSEGQRISGAISHGPSDSQSAEVTWGNTGRRAIIGASWC